MTYSWVAGSESAQGRQGGSWPAAALLPISAGRSQAAPAAAVGASQPEQEGRGRLGRPGGTGAVLAGEASLDNAGPGTIEGGAGGPSCFPLRRRRRRRLWTDAGRRNRQPGGERHRRPRQRLGGSNGPSYHAFSPAPGGRRRRGCPRHRRRHDHGVGDDRRRGGRRQQDRRGIPAGPPPRATSSTDGSAGRGLAATARIWPPAARFLCRDRFEHDRRRGGSGVSRRRIGGFGGAGGAEAGLWRKRQGGQPRRDPRHGAGGDGAAGKEPSGEQGFEVSVGQGGAGRGRNRVGRGGAVANYGSIGGGDAGSPPPTGYLIYFQASPPAGAGVIVAAGPGKLANHGMIAGGAGGAGAGSPLHLPGQLRRRGRWSGLPAWPTAEPCSTTARCVAASAGKAGPPSRWDWARGAAEPAARDLASAGPGKSSNFGLFAGGAGGSEEGAAAYTRRRRRRRRGRRGPRRFRRDEHRQPVADPGRPRREPARAGGPTPAAPAGPAAPGRR